MQRILILLALLLATPVAAQDCASPADLKDGWQIATPQSQGLDPAPLCSIGTRFEAWKEANAHSVLVLRHGRLVYERYFTGADQRYGTSLGIVSYDADKLHDLRSISKSIVSLLTGIAVDKGWLSIDQSVFAFFPEHGDLRTPEKDRITIRHLLIMAAGFAWDENLPYTNPANSEIRMMFAKDRLRYVLEQPIVVEPGKVYNYSGGATALLGGILQKVSGRRIDTLAKEELFAPLGIRDFEWMPYQPDGEPATASGLRLRPRDLARIGQMVLDKGRWQGKQIVSESWIAASIAPQINGQSPFFYGYQWWLGRSLLDQQQIDWAAGLGLGGQRVYVVPALDAVVVVTTGLYNSGLQGAIGPIVLNQHVLPAVVKE
jgi:CubicO group peptidase (beta-lactamase class C family)